MEIQAPPVIETQAPTIGETFTVEREHFNRLLNGLSRQGYQLVGPTIREGAIVYDTLTDETDLPIGWADEQERGIYRLKQRNDAALFGYTVGPRSWKQFLHPPARRLWQAKRINGSFEIIEEPQNGPKYAFIGVRACELRAIAIQDKVFLQGDFLDPTYRLRREQAFIVAVNCGQAGNTCFCASMDAGPKVDQGFDLALTEILQDKRHFFVVEVGTEKGAAVIGQLPCQQASPADLQLAQQVSEQAASQMGRTLDTTDIKALFYRNLDHPYWDEVANRCLTCANCTMVCPTCFCTTVEDVTDLTGRQAERWRKWDSCFTTAFSYVYGGSVRASAKARYRQWLSHKLATWVDQFGSLGCVGCGRCITWCPVGIDITEEVRTIRQVDVAAGRTLKEDNDEDA